MSHLSLCAVFLLAACGDDSEQERAAGSAEVSAATPGPSASSAPSGSAQPARSPTPHLEHIQSIVSTSSRLYALGKNASLTSWRPAQGRDPEPEQIEAVRSIHAANNVVCALAVSGKVFCKDDTAEWNNAGPPREWLPLPLAGVVALGGSALRWPTADGEYVGEPLWFAVLEDGTVRVFDIDYRSFIRSVRPVEGISRAKLVAVGQEHACVVVEGGAVQCWHHGWSSTEADEDEPVRPRLGKVAFTDAVGVEGPCIRKATGPLHCLVMASSWQEGERHDHRAQWVEGGGFVHRMQGPRAPCRVVKDRLMGCEPRVEREMQGAADVAVGSKHFCALMRFDVVVCNLR